MYGKPRRESVPLSGIGQLVLLNGTQYRIQVNPYERETYLVDTGAERGAT